MTTLKKTFLAVCAAALLFTALPGGASAAEGEWSYTVVPYLWLTGIDGEVQVADRTLEPSLSFGDLFDNLDFGLQGYFEARKDKLGLFLDATYMKLSTDRTVAGVTTELEVTNWLVEFGALYEVWATSMGEGKTVSLDLLGGGRYSSLDNELSAPGLFSVSGSESYVDPIVGARLNADVAAKVPLVLRGDIGGFGIGSEFSWQILALLGYRFTPTMTLWGGYRVLDIDVEEGELDGRFENKITMSGPIVGFAFGF